MDRLLIAAAIVAVAVVVALIVRRRRPDAPTQPAGRAPTQLDRHDFERPDAPWLVAVFTSATCHTCADVVAKAAVLASDEVAVTDVEWQTRRDVHDRYRIDSVPLLVIADRDGVVRGSFAGPVTATDLWAAVAAARDPLRSLRAPPIRAAGHARGSPGMGARELTTVVDQMTFTECPRWRDGRLYFSDFYTYRVMSVVPGRDAEEIVSVPQQPSGLGWLPDGRMLVVSMRDRKILRQEQSGELVEHADLSAVTGGHVNDMVVAPSGIAYAGNFGFDLMAGDPIKPTPLVRIDPDGAVSIASEPLMFPNGSAITPDGKTLVISESIGNRMSAFDIAADGSLGPRRDWAALGPVPTSTDAMEALGAVAFAPDGMCLDADGAVWVADSAGNRVIRLAEGGEILDEIATGEGCYACMLGGDDGRTLFMCVAPDFHEDARKAAREARIVGTTVDVPHAGTP